MADAKKQNKDKNRNPDPITGEPGSHPVGVGLGTAGGATAGAAIGAVGGPIGAVVGAVIGGITGGMSGKGVAEAIDPTAEDAYWRENYHSRPYATKKASYETYQPAYRYGSEAYNRHTGKKFDEVEAELGQGWEKARGNTTLSWDEAKPAVRDAFDRTIQLREEELSVHKQPVKTGEVRVHKEVVTEHKTLEVPVTREEIVVERRPVSGKAASGEVRAEEVRIPVMEEQVHLEKQAVVKEEVSIGKRKVQETEHVEGSVRKEKLRVEKEGKVDVHDKDKRK